MFAQCKRVMRQNKRIRGSTAVMVLAVCSSILDASAGDVDDGRDLRVIELDHVGCGYATG